MAIVNKTNQRYRSELKTFSDPDIANLDAAYNGYEAGLAADASKTYQTRVIASGWDGVNYFLFAETTYPEISDDPLGEVPPPA